jgi:transposase-like protein
MKRKYSEKQMSLLMQEYEASQMSADVFALAHSIPKSTFYRWRIRYKQSLEQSAKQFKAPEFTSIPLSTQDEDVLPEGAKRKEIEIPTATNIGQRLIITTPSGLRLELDV